jgi:hypothetical protein
MISRLYFQVNSMHPKVVGELPIPLTISGTPALAVLENTLYSFIFDYTIPVGTTATIAVDNLPDWLILELIPGTLSGRISGTPSYPDRGQSTIMTVYITDGTDTVNLTPFTINVVYSNRAPIFIPGANNPILNKVNGDYYIFAPVYADPDVIDTITFSLINDTAGLGVNTAYGYVYGTLSINGVHTITLRATDSYGLFTDLVWTLTVTAGVSSVSEITSFAATARLSSLTFDITLLTYNTATLAWLIDATGVSTAPVNNDARWLTSAPTTGTLVNGYDTVHNVRIWGKTSATSGVGTVSTLPGGPVQLISYSPWQMPDYSTFIERPRIIYNSETSLYGGPIGDGMVTNYYPLPTTQNLQHLGIVSAALAPFSASTGASNNQVMLKNALEFGRYNMMPVYLDAGTYPINGKLQVYQGTYNRATNPTKQVFGDREGSIELQGDINGGTIINVVAGTFPTPTGGATSSTAIAAIEFLQRSASAPLTTLKPNDQFNGGLKDLKIIVQANNDNCTVISAQGAQGNNHSNLEIDMTLGGFIGVISGPGSGGTSNNLKVTGGAYAINLPNGLAPGSQPGAEYAGFQFTDQTQNAVLWFGPQCLTLTGGEINVLAGLTDLSHAPIFAAGTMSTGTPPIFNPSAGSETRGGIAIKDTKVIFPTTLSTNVAIVSGRPVTIDDGWFYNCPIIAYVRSSNHAIVNATYNAGTNLITFQTLEDFNVAIGDTVVNVGCLDSLGTANTYTVAAITVPTATYASGGTTGRVVETLTGNPTDWTHVKHWSYGPIINAITSKWTEGTVQKSLDRSYRYGNFIAGTEHNHAYYIPGDTLLNASATPPSDLRTRHLPNGTGRITSWQDIDGINVINVKRIGATSPTDNTTVNNAHYSLTGSTYNLAGDYWTDDAPKLKLQVAALSGKHLVFPKGFFGLKDQVNFGTTIPVGVSNNRSHLICKGGGSIAGFDNAGATNFLAITSLSTTATGHWSNINLWAPYDLHGAKWLKWQLYNAQRNLTGGWNIGLEVRSAFGYGNGGNNNNPDIKPTPVWNETSMLYVTGAALGCGCIWNVIQQGSDWYQGKNYVVLDIDTSGIMEVHGLNTEHNKGLAATRVRSGATLIVYTFKGEGNYCQVLAEDSFFYCYGVSGRMQPFPWINGIPAYHYSNGIGYANTGYDIYNPAIFILVDMRAYSIGPYMDYGVFGGTSNLFGDGFDPLLNKVINVVTGTVNNGTPFLLRPCCTIYFALTAPTVTYPIDPIGAADLQTITPIQMTAINNTNNEALRYDEKFPGSLPPGLAISTTGLISGTVTDLSSVNSPYIVVITVSTPEGAFVDHTLTFNIAAANSILVDTFYGTINTVIHNRTADTIHGATTWQTQTAGLILNGAGLLVVDAASITNSVSVKAKITPDGVQVPRTIVVRLRNATGELIPPVECLTYSRVIASIRRKASGSDEIRFRLNTKFNADGSENGATTMDIVSVISSVTTTIAAPVSLPAGSNSVLRDYTITDSGTLISISVTINGTTYTVSTEALFPVAGGGYTIQNTERLVAIGTNCTLPAVCMPEFDSISCSPT